MTAEHPYLRLAVHFGVLRWPLLDALWQRGRRPPRRKVGTSTPWAKNPQRKPSRAMHSARSYASWMNCCTANHQDYCGIVYTDSMTNPAYIKVFDPNNLDQPAAPAATRPARLDSVEKRNRLTCPQPCPNRQKTGVAGGTTCLTMHTKTLRPFTSLALPAIS